MGSKFEQTAIREFATSHGVTPRHANRALTSHPALEVHTSFALRNEAIKAGVRIDNNRPPAARISLMATIDDLGTERVFEWFHYATYYQDCESRLVLFDRTLGSNNEVDELTKLSDEPVDGIVVLRSGLTEHQLDQNPTRSPMVFIDPTFELRSQKMREVIPVDYASGMQQAVEYLKKLGHTQIAFLSGVHQDTPIYTAKEHAYEQAMQNESLSEHIDVISYDAESTEDAGMYEPGRQMTLAVLDPEENGVVPTAVIAGTTEYAVGAMRAVYDRDKKAPDDLSIIGIGNYTLARNWSPRTIDCLNPQLNMSVFDRAIELLLAELKSENEYSPTLQQPISVWLQLGERGSTGPATLNAAGNQLTI